MAVNVGERFVRAQDAARGTTSNTTAADISYDTSILSDGSGFTYNGPDVEVDTAGLYLCMFDLGYVDLTGVARACGTLVPRVNGSTDLTRFRASHRYLRDSGGTSDGASYGNCILDLSASDNVRVRNPGALTPTDATLSYATKSARGGALQVLKLPDDTNFTHVERTSDAAEVGTSDINTTRPWIDSSGTWTKITYNSEVVDDDGLYSGSGGDITLAADTKYLVVWGATIYSSDTSRHCNVTALNIDSTRVQTSTGYHRDTSHRGAPMQGMYLHETGGSTETLYLEATHETEGGDAGTPNVSDAYLQVFELPSSAEWIHVDNGTTDSLTTALASVSTYYDTPLSSTFRADGDSNLSLDGTNNAVQNDSGGSLPVLAIGWVRWDRDAGSSGTRKVPMGRWDNGGTQLRYGINGAYSRGQQADDDTWQAHYVSAVLTDLADAADLSWAHIDEGDASNNDMGVYASTNRHFLGMQVLNLESLESTGAQTLTGALFTSTNTWATGVASTPGQYLTGSGHTDLDGTDGYIQRPGVSLGTGDKTLIMYVRKDDWTPAADETLFSQWNIGGANRSDLLQINTSGLILYTIHDGTSGKSWATAATGWTDGSGRWIRIDIDVDNGASDADLSVYTSDDAPTVDPTGISWGTAELTPVGPGSVVSPQGITTDIIIGARDSATPAGFAAVDVYYLAYWRDGLEGAGGTQVIEYDARDSAPSASVLVDGVDAEDWTHNDGWSWAGGRFESSNTWSLGEISSAAGQTLTGALFTSTNTWETGTVTPGTVTVTGTLFTSTNSWATGTVTAGPVSLTGALFTSTNTWPLGTVTPGPVSATGSLFTSSNTWAAGTVTPGPVSVTGTLFTSSNTWPTGILSPAVTLTGVLFTSSNTWLTGAVTPSTTLTGALFTSTNTWHTGALTGTVTLTGNLFTSGNTWPVGTVTAGPVTLTGTLFTSTNTWPQGTIDLATVGDLFTSSNTWPAGSVQPGPVTVTGVLFTSTNTWPQGTVAAGGTVLTGTLFTSTNTWPQGTVTAGPVTLTGALFTSTNTWNTGTVTAGPVTLTGTLFTSTNTWLQGSVATGTVTLTGNLFASSNTWLAGTVAAGPVTLTGVLFTSTNTWSVGAVTSGTTLTGALFTSTNTWATGAATVAPLLTGTLFTSSNTFPTGQVQPGPVTITGALFTSTNDWYTGTATFTITGTLFTSTNTWPTGVVQAGTVAISGTLFTSTNTWPTGTITTSGAWWTFNPTDFTKDPVAVTADPVAHSRDPVAVTNDPVGFVKVSAGDTAPWN